MSDPTDDAPATTPPDGHRSGASGDAQADPTTEAWMAALATLATEITDARRADEDADLDRALADDPELAALMTTPDDARAQALWDGAVGATASTAPADVVPFPVSSPPEATGATPPAVTSSTPTDAAAEGAPGRVASLVAARERRRPPTARFGAPLVAAAAVVLAVLAWPSAPEPSEPTVSDSAGVSLPTYGLELSGGVRDMRSDDEIQATEGATTRFAPSTRVDVVLRPADSVPPAAMPVGLRVLATPGEGVDAAPRWLAPQAQVSPTGAIRVTGAFGQRFSELTPGPWSLEFVVAPQASLPADADATVPDGPGQARHRANVLVLPAP